MELSATREVKWVASGKLPAGYQLDRSWSGKSTNALPGFDISVAQKTSGGPPTRNELERLHRERVGNTALQSAVVVLCADETVAVFGPDTKRAPVIGLDRGHAQRILQDALSEPSAADARQRLNTLWQAVDSSQLAGVRNSGLFASHELRVGVPQRADWGAACERSRTMVSERGLDLIRALGFTARREGAEGYLLEGPDERGRAIAVLLDESESFDAATIKFPVSPVAYGLRIAQRLNLSWLIMVRAGQIRLYPASSNLAVGGKGLAETFLELDLPQLGVDRVGYLSLIFSAEALSEGGTAYETLAASAQYAVALGERLRDKVYDEIIPDLSLAVAEQMIDLGYEMDPDGLDLAYQITLRIFFRLLFQVYAEDRHLLPFNENDRYTRNALKTLAADFVANPDEEVDPESAALWDDLAQVWHVIDGGDRSWGVPAYNGGLFSSDEELHPHGALIGKLRIHNDVMGPVLRALLLDAGADGETGPIDFRSLSVREFGTIYEGLLESSLGLAEVDLTLDDKGTWLPVKKKSDEVHAYAGQVYFHNTSGQRKGTGSYFTPSFVVEHLLERSLDPALDDHLERVAALIKSGDQAGAADLFFDFKVADLAMGSGHFLSAAIDHIEAKMAAFLAEDGNQIPGVAKELSLLFQAAKDAVGPDVPEPEPSSLLRRQIARRCIYGLDMNPIAVELARVSIWIHTFVRGLPMSSLDHNLVCGNSLTGIGSVEEAVDVLVPGRKGAPTLFDAPIEEALQSARTVLVDVANLPELSRKETHAASKAVRQARKEAETAKLLFDAAVLTRIGREGLVAMSDVDAIAKAAAAGQAQDVIAPLQPAHMPVLFPEVFLRDNGGFDVLVGNPPWEKLHVEEHQWWSLRFLGLRGMPMAARTKQLAELRASRPDLVREYEAEVENSSIARQIIASGPYPGIGSGHIDLYKAFAWRNWQLIRSGGSFGLVLPRGALSGSGTEKWRREILEQGAFRDVAVTVNTGHWVFNIHGQYTTAFVTVDKGPVARVARWAGPFHSLNEFHAGRNNMAEAPAKELSEWTKTAVFPLLPSRESGNIFRQMRTHPVLRSQDSSFFMPVQGDLNSAQNKDLFSTEIDAPISETPVLTGSSFNLWSPDYGKPYGYATADAVPFILEKTIKSAARPNSVFNGLDIAETKNLPLSRARIAFRDVTNPTNSRTMLCCLVPPGNVLVHKAPYLVRRAGSEIDEAFLLGVFSSIIFDWFARRIVELTMSFELLTTMPIPKPSSDDPLRLRLVQLAGRLAATDRRFDDWANAVGVPVGSIITPAKWDHLKVWIDEEAEIDALVAHLFGLSRSQVEHIFETFHRGWDYKPRLDAVLEHFDRIGGEK